MEVGSWWRRDLILQGPGDSLLSNEGSTDTPGHMQGEAMVAVGQG
jgi:hypothetical protein